MNKKYRIKSCPCCGKSLTLDVELMKIGYKNFNYFSSNCFKIMS